jgi:hypothetical protein
VHRTKPIQAGSVVRLKVLFYDPASGKSPEGQTEAAFLAGWRSFTFVASYGGHRHQISVSQDEVMAAIEAVREKPPKGPLLPTPMARECVS